MYTIQQLQNLYRAHNAPTNAPILTVLYLDYWCNFLTVAGFAAHYGISKKAAQNIIDTGRKLFNN